MPRYSWVLQMIIIMMLSNPVIAQQQSIRTVVIDAGHGGHDPGALGTTSKEKNINLSIALKLGNMIQRNLKDVKVYYTRDRDYFVELYRRAELANERKADLFISIHCNANRSHALHGAETYVMGLHKSQANLDIAKLENASILLESDYQSSYGGFDPNSDESYITFSLAQNSNLEQSTEFAAMIQDQMSDRVGMNDRGVRQAGFLVLWKTTMPSVLVEVGYLSNYTEEKFLQSSKGQDYIASAIYRAFVEFRGSSAGVRSPEPIPAEVRTRSVETGVDQNTVLQQQNQTPTGGGKTSKSQPTTPSAGGLSYRVQIAVSTTDIGTSNARFRQFKKVKMYQHQGMYKYTIGDEKSLQAAEKLMREAKSKGIKDAFVVIFREDQRISQSEAERIMGK